MQNQILNNASQAPQASWSGTHEAKAAIFLSARTGVDCPFPVAVARPVATSKPFGTVAMLCQNPDLMVQLRPSLAASNVVMQLYFSLPTILADPMPLGPACLVIELDGRDMQPLESFEQLRAKGWRLPIIVLIGKADIRTVVQLMRAGAEDVLLNTCEPAELIAAINSALARSRKGLQHRSQDHDLQRRRDLLTAREAEIVKLVLDGLLNKEIAEKLHLALVTIKVHRGSAMRKLGARSAAELGRLTLTSNGLDRADFAGSRVEWPLVLNSLPAE
jgi:FixJ family two-component response regulator